MKIHKCVNCSAYTLAEKCPKCGDLAVSPKPPKFSLQDKYADYRRKIKRVDLVKKGLLHS